MSGRPLSNAIGFDDAPFPRGHRGDVAVVGAVYGGARLDGVLTGRVRRDGANATAQLAALVAGSPFADALQVVFVQGIALAGFNVVDVHALHLRTRRPVLVVARREPDLGAILRALGRVPGGARKWRLIARAGPMEPCAGVWVQRAGLDPATAEATVRLHQRNGLMPEPLRTAHLVAGALARGMSHGRA